MSVTLVDYSGLQQISPTDLSYIRQDDRLREFYAFKPTPDTIEELIDSRKKFPVDRGLLLKVLKKQYEELERELPFSDEEILNENTFTITTAHQPTLLTGPLFHIYKIANVIRLARDLSEQHPGNNFIPVFVMSGEDHDWAEVNHLHLFGKKIEWKIDAHGPCGHLSTDGLADVIEKVHDVLLNSKHASEIQSMLRDCVSKAKNYGHFHRILVSALFDGNGLVIIDLDDKELKQAFIPVFEKEIRERFSFEDVTATQKELEKKGFKPQAYCRPVNFFYMSDGARERVDIHEEGFIRIGSGITYTQEELIVELHDHAERFSPNVILRPLYQEFILPDIAYVGGGGEIAYWLERKSQFASAGVHYPMLIRRNSFLLIDRNSLSQLSKLDISPEEIIHELHVITKSYLHKHSQVELNFDEELEKINTAYEALAAKAEKIDPTLSKAILAEESKQIKQFEHLGLKLLKAEKLQQETQLKRIQRIKDKLFPNGGLQERHENFLSFYAEYGRELINELIEAGNPWVKKFILLEPAP